MYSSSSSVRLLCLIDRRSTGYAQALQGVLFRLEATTKSRLESKTSLISRISGCKSSFGNGNRQEGLVLVTEEIDRHLSNVDEDKRQRNTRVPANRRTRVLLRQIFGSIMLRVIVD